MSVSSITSTTLVQGHFEVIASLQCTNLLSLVSLAEVCFTHKHVQVLHQKHAKQALTCIFTHSLRFRVMGISVQWVGCIVFPWRSIFSTVLAKKKKGQQLKCAVILLLMEKGSHFASCKHESTTLFFAISIWEQNVQIKANSTENKRQLRVKACV